MQMLTLPMNNDGHISIVLILIIAFIVLFLLIKHKLDEADTVVEYVPLDENDPQVKQMLTERNALLTELLGHISAIMSFSFDEMNESLIVDNLDVDKTAVTIPMGDIVIKLFFHWGKKVRVSFFRNQKISSKHLIEKSKVLRIKENTVSLKKLTHFLLKCREASFKLDDKNGELYSACIAAAKAVVDKGNMTEEEFRAFLFSLILDYDIDDFKHKQDAVNFLTSTLIYIFHTYPEEFKKLLK